MKIGSRKVIAAVLAAAIVVGVGAWLAFRSDSSGPEDVATDFASAWTAGDREQLRELVTDPAALDRIDPIAVVSDLGATEPEIQVLDAEASGAEARAPFTIRLALGDVATVSWNGALPLVDTEEGWRIDWGEQALHPDIPEGGTIRRATTWPDRAPILGVGDRPIVGPVETIRVGIEPQRFDREASVPVLAEQLGVPASEIEAALDAPGVEPDHFVPIAELRPAEFEAIRDVVFPIPGVTFPRGTGRGGPVEGFARHLVGRHGEITAERLEELGPPYRVGDEVGLDGLEATFERRLAGEPAVEVRVVDADGEVVVVVASFEGEQPSPVRTTLDPDVQLAAEHALADVATPAALVVVDAATGEVRASVARPLHEAFNRAIAGMYPPGSTFKVMSAYALLTDGLVLDSPVDCPAELSVGGRRFRNFEGDAAGTVPFSRAFAQSCNTAIIGATQELPAGALAEAASTFGFGVDYSLGPTTLGGSFPEPGSEVERAAAAIGQAEVTASPLHMSTVAAAVADGTWRSPRLLTDDGGGPPTTRQLQPAARDQLATLMRLVVAEGTGTAAQVPGVDLLGKTGTAEFGAGDPPPTHAWFIAAGDGLGAAVILEDGGVGGRDAAPVMARFFEALRAQRPS